MGMREIVNAIFYVLRGFVASCGRAAFHGELRGLEPVQAVRQALGDGHRADTVFQ